MEGMAGQKSSLAWAVNISAFLLVLLWTIPTLGLFVSSFRDRDQISTSGWWQSFSGSEQTGFVRSGVAGDQVQQDGLYVIEGSAIEGTQALKAWGTGARNPAEYQPGDTADLGDGISLTVAEDGAYRLTSAQPFEITRGERIFTTTVSPPSFTTENYNRVLTAGGLWTASLLTGPRDSLAARLRRHQHYRG